MKNRFIPLLPLLAILAAPATSALAQANLAIYTDNPANAFQDWSWATRNMANTSPVHSGSKSISVTDVAWTAVSFQHPNFNTTPYASLSFWAHGGTGGGQRLQVNVQYGASGSGPTYALPTALTLGAWTQYVIPLTSLGVANTPNVNRINIQLTASGTTSTFYIDDIQLIAAPAPAPVHLNVDGTNTLRTVDARWFGVNTAIWDSSFDTSTTTNLLNELGCLTLRFPGGSASDEYYWTTGKSWTNTWAWTTSWANFIHVATNVGAQVFITVNYGTGSSNYAAAWVKSANITNHCNFKYWEIGNECYGTWEHDTNTPAHDPYTYAVRAAGYMAMMRAADSTIKIGIVVAPGENSYSNNANHFAKNPRTGTINYGWTPVVFQTLSNLNVFPDFVIHHVYPQSTESNSGKASDSDPFVLQSTANWALDAADLRQQLQDYFGATNTSIEIICTENNSDSGAVGRQLTSVVNGLYIADSMAQIMKTEIDGYLWWDLRNGQGTDGSFDPTLYGWRTYGDEGLTIGTSPYMNYPSFYGFKMMQYFARPGDTILSATSDYLLLSAYAGHKPNGSLTLLVINKDTTTSFTAQVNLTNFIPSASTSATVRSYGIPQDEADRTNGPNHDITTTYTAASALFTNTFAPASLTVFTFTPLEPKVQALAVDSNNFTLQLQGSPGAPYIIQTSTDLTSGVWNAVSTNTLAASSLNLTNTLSPGTSQQYWRAVWQP